MNEDRPLWLQAIAIAMNQRGMQYLPNKMNVTGSYVGVTYHEQHLPPALRDIPNDESSRLPEFEDWAQEEVASLCVVSPGEEEFAVRFWSWHHFFPSGGLEIEVWR